ncbi:hypothetical protein [Melioribacter sp. OK-6-Me]|uniref:hypothetical protein n=1 Tax=unclassified Melioribacter TaxID=2627329 RepID=UPI003ED8EDAF
MLTRLVFLLIVVINASAQQEFYEIKIISESPGVSIFVDNQFVGYDTISVKLNRGKHTILIFESPLIWNGMMIVDTIIVDESSSQTFNYQLPSVAVINSKPNDAIVRVNNKFKGYTPLRIFCFDEDVVSVSRNGIECKYSGVKDKLNVNLEVLPERQKARFSSSTNFKLLMASSLLLGGIAAYFKLRADSIYEDYLRSGDNELYEKVNRYDIYSGIAFGLLQINFGYLFYKLLTED